MAEMRDTGIDTLLRFAIGAGAGGFRTAGPSMATPEYYGKQIELLLDWADTVTNAELQISLIQRALDFLPLANWADDQTLQRLQERLHNIAMPSDTLKP